MHALKNIFDLQKWNTIHTLVHLCINRYFWLMTPSILWGGIIQTPSTGGHLYSLLSVFWDYKKSNTITTFVHPLTSACISMGQIPRSKNLIDATTLVSKNAVATYFYMSILILCISVSKVFYHSNFSVLMGIEISLSFHWLLVS